MINIKVIKRVTEARWPQFDSKNTRESNLIKYKEEKSVLYKLGTIPEKVTETVSTKT